MGGDADPTVLIVDDNPDIANLYAGHLAESYRVRVVHSGERALSGLDGDVDIVLLDRRMPGLSGDEVLSVIRERDIDCLVVLVTAVDPGLDVAEMPCDDYLVKPVSKADLVSAVDRMLARATYGDVLQRYFALASRRAAIETHDPNPEFDGSEEFERLESRIDRLQSRADEALAELEPYDLECLFRDLART